MAKRKAIVNIRECVACGCCIKVCPRGAISVPKGIYAEIDKSLCIGCGKCAQALSQWRRQHNEAKKEIRIPYNDLIQAPLLVRILPHGNDDAAYMQGKEHLYKVSFRRRFLSMILIPPRETSTIPSPAKYFSTLDTTSRADPI